MQTLEIRGLFSSLNNYQDHYGNNALHLSAARGHFAVSMHIADKYSTMVMATNFASDLPVEVALKHSHDDVAAFLIRRMSHYRYAQVITTNIEKLEKIICKIMLF